MPHTHIHLHEADEDDPPAKAPEPTPPAMPSQTEEPAKPSPPEMSPQAAKTAARRLGRTLKIDPQEGLRDVAKYFGDEVAARFSKIAELMGIDEAVADLEDHIAGMSEKKPMPGLGRGLPRRDPGPLARDARRKKTRWVRFRASV